MNSTNKSIRLSIILVAWQLIVGCQKVSTTQVTLSNDLIGAWHVQAINWVSADQTHRIDVAQPGMFIFSEDHYALMWSPSQTPRTPFQTLAKPTDQEMIQGFQSIVFNAGSYQIVDDEMVTQAYVAKVPGFEGGQQFFRFNLTGDQLLLIMYDEIYPDGSKPNWSGQWQTQFSLIKAVP